MNHFKVSIILHSAKGAGHLLPPSLLQIARNKGLAPKRKKEQRNPRVKHRKKFDRAKVRRKGQVRSVVADEIVYGGERSGIKSTVSRSIKLN